MADLMDTLDRLLSDPEIRAAAEEPQPPGDALPVGGSAFGALPPELLGKLPMLMGALGPMLGKADGKKDEKTALLLALKPYLSPERCAAVDYLIRLSRVGDAIRAMQ
jgi:hypothetical protein